MKYAMPFVLFQFFLISLYIFAVIFTGSPEKAKLLAESLSADKFSVSFNLSNGDLVHFNGSKFYKLQDRFKFSSPEGYYSKKDDGVKVFFSGRQGQITNDKDFYLKGNVELKSNDAIFLSDELFYNFKAKTYKSPAPVTVISKDGKFEGTGFIYNVAERKMELKNVKGRIQF